ncbi:MAG: 4-(cytidine 5'-diphospho)-2-C-methyl-D-erythritol kinase [bacterium]
MINNKINSREMVLYARAKINPTLDVIGKLDNGYHNLEMTMQTVNTYDTLKITPNNTGEIKLITNIDWLPTDEKNLVYKTANYLKQTYNIQEGIKINLYKNIPVSAGLAGGSTDCAATLIAIRNMFKLPISNEELESIGKQLGADVPFCLQRGTALARGIGDELTQLKPFPYCYIVIVKPSISVSTRSVFERLDLNSLDKSSRPDTEKFLYYLNKSNLEGICDNLSNVLESVTLNQYPILHKIKYLLKKYGALGTLMSGSGSSIYGIFRTKKQAVFASKSISRNVRIQDIFVTTPFNNFNK